MTGKQETETFCGKTASQWMHERDELFAELSEVQAFVKRVAYGNDGLKPLRWSAHRLLGSGTLGQLEKYQANEREERRKADPR